MKPANKYYEIRRDDDLEDLFEDLRREHRTVQPPATLEKAILERTGLEQIPPRTRRLPLYSWSLALAATIVIAIILLYPRLSHPTIETRTAPPPAPKSIHTPAPLKIDAHPARLRPHLKRPQATRRQNSPGPFVSLPTGMGLPEPAQTMFIRTRITTSSLRNYGLASPPAGAPQTILAEFLVGEDGLPRAIRLIP